MYATLHALHSTYPIYAMLLFRYYPELKLGRCVMKYTRTLYPELMQMRLSYDTVSKYLRSLYYAIYGYISEMINENRQDIENEQRRIGLKVTQMTLHDVTSSSLFQPPAALPSTASSPLSISSSQPINHVKSPSPYNYNDGNFNYMQKFRPLFSNHRDANHLNPNFSTKQNYENELAVAQSFNDFSPRTHSMDVLKFDKNNFFSNSINAKEYDTNKSFLLESEVPFDLKKFETKHSDNYNVPSSSAVAADLSSSSSSVILSTSTTTTSADTFDRAEIDKNGKFSKTLAALENNLNVEESQKPNTFSVMYIGPRQFSTDYQDDMSPALDDTPTLDLNKNSNGYDDEKGAGDDDSNIFDFENVILESFGFDAKAVKSSALFRCISSYVINLFRRTFEYFILM